MKRGYIQVYTGNGKGKTTAALGLALRAAGAGLRVFIMQFIKESRCSEHKALERFTDLITIRQSGKGFILKSKPTDSDIAAAGKGLDEVKTIMRSGECDLLILDEVNVAVNRGLISAAALLEVMDMKPENMELVITGRYACEEVVAKADLVTEMKEIRHYAKKDVKARVGIEK